MSKIFGFFICTVFCLSPFQVRSRYLLSTTTSCIQVGFDIVQRQVANLELNSFLMGQSRPLFVYFSFFSQCKDEYSTQILTIIDKSVDGVLRPQTQGGRMEGADEFTSLWRHPITAKTLHHKSTRLQVHVFHLSRVHQQRKETHYGNTSWMDEYLRYSLIGTQVGILTYLPTYLPTYVISSYSTTQDSRVVDILGRYTERTN